MYNAPIAFGPGEADITVERMPRKCKTISTLTPIRRHMRGKATSPAAKRAMAAATARTIRTESHCLGLSGTDSPLAPRNAARAAQVSSTAEFGRMITAPAAARVPAKTRPTRSGVTDSLNTRAQRAATASAASPVIIHVHGLENGHSFSANLLTAEPLAIAMTPQRRVQQLPDEAG